ncbi:serine/threonine-protein kinase LMTK1-like isoform X2 [Coregonus clupeaformis]|uniref:serine/threonine-protein kinase LMTK1-like isoform X2 n=1 Tax=Coregonus clupeaformis TaxID=59861 RepID=UPI001E1C4121|nr:serine/threonine-protein kinase LMTK1-like isoform X2 [Coregonus clupeaformis]
MFVALSVMVMSSAFFNPSFAFSSHFDSDGAPLSELSWPSSLAVVAVSFSGLFTFVFLMLACLCCKKGHIGFKEFENTEGEEYQADLTSSHNGPEVYILPLTEVSLPVSKQPGRSIQLLKSSELGRHSLLYVKEIGHGWFGKVLLGEVNAGLSATQVVVKELKASASVQDQMHFLEEAQPYRVLQNPALLQCLAQCSEVTPYLLIMEFCPLGDLKSYLRSCRAANSVTPDPLTLQRMACEIASGLLHLHKHNFIHSDLALRNCLLTSEMTVKIGDYGLSHSKYKDDYFVTPDQIWVPLRWIAPELIDEVHGNLLVVDQTKDSNVWSLGVTIWELFELGNQPYRHYTDRQVLTYAVKEQQLKLTKPRLKVPLAERWYEVMQFCWLQPEQRPNSEEVHLLLTYLCAKGASAVQEDFEQRWNSLRHNLTGSSTHSHNAPAHTTVPAPARPTIPGDVKLEPASTSRNSFPLLEHFSQDSFHSDSGDDILTVTETSYGGLNFEYKWEQARAEQPYCSSSTSGPLGQGNPHYQDVYYPVRNTSTSGSCKGDGGGGGLTLDVSPSYYESDHSGSGSGSGVGVVPVLSAHSPSVGSEYYIRIEEPVECNINLDGSVVDYSPGLEAEAGSLSSGSRTPKPQPQPQPQSSANWPAAAAGDSSGDKHSTNDSDNSPAVSLTMEPLLRQTASTASPVELGRSQQYFSPNQRQAFYCEQSPIRETCCQSPEDTPIASQRNLRHPTGRLETPLGVGSSHSQCLSSPSLGHCDPYLEASQGFTTTARSTVSEGYYDMMAPLRKTLPMANHISIDVVTGNGGLLVGGRRRGEGDTGDINDGDLFSEREATNWTSNHSANNNSMTFDLRQTGQSQDSYLDLHYINTATHSATVTDSWPAATANSSNMLQHSSRAFGYMEATGRESGVCSSSSRLSEGSSATTYIHLCHGARDEPVCLSVVTDHSTLDHLRGVPVDSLSSSSVAVKNVNLKGGVKDCVPTTKTTTTVSVVGHSKTPSLLTGERQFSHPKMIPEPGCIQSPSTYMEPDTRTGLSTKAVLTEKQGGHVWEIPSHVKDIRGPVAVMSGGVGERRLGMGLAHPEGVLLEPVGSLFEASRGLDSGLEMASHSSISQVDISDDDIIDITSGILAKFSLDYADEVGDDISPAHHRHGHSLQNPVGTSDSVDTLNMLSLSSSVTAASPCEAFSLDDVFLHTSSSLSSSFTSSSFTSSSLLPKSLDSGYDTENNESPEFILKEGGGNGEFLLDCVGNHHQQQQHPVLGGSHLARSGVCLGSRSDEMVLQQVDLGDGVGVSLCTSSSSGCTELQLKGLSDKNPYMDSAYFSDYDVENERSPQDEGSNFFSSPGDKQVFVGHTASKQTIRSVGRDELQPQTEREDGYRDLTDLTGNKNRNTNGVVVFDTTTGSPPPSSPSSSAPGPRLSMLAPFPPQMGGCLAKESAPDEAVGLESEHSGEEPASGCSSTMVSEGSSMVQEASARHPNQENHHRASEDDYSPIQSLGSDSTIDYREEVKKEKEEDGEGEEDMPEFNHVEEDGENGERGGEEEEYEEGEEEEEEKAGYSGHQNGPVGLLTSSPSLLSCSPSLQELCREVERRAPLTEGEEEESDDSESDEELRSYNLQEELSEEDSEGEVMGVPVVVSDSSGARNLRSLLKMPALLTQSFCDELHRKKKAVSFFDDVTVFLFDQESPTGELADFTFPPGAEFSGQASGGENPQPDLQPHPTMGHHLHPPERAPHASEDSDGNMSEEGGGFEWEDDIPLMTSPLSSPSTAEPPVSDPIPVPIPIPVPAAKPPEDKPVAAASQFPRFSVSRSRFSITHVPNPDINSAGGQSWEH